MLKLKLTCDDETFLDRSDVGEEVLQLVPAGVGRNVGHLDGAPAPAVPGVHSHLFTFLSSVSSEL